MSEKQVLIYPYVMTYDTGFAPCVANSVLTLATCKTFLRYKIGCNYNDENDIYVMGLCGKQLAERQGIDCELEYSPVYIAKIKGVEKTCQYFSGSGRPDQKYCYANGIWYIKKNNPHHLDYDNIVPFAAATSERDLYYLPRLNKENPPFNYVLFSDEYLYWGKKISDNPAINNSVKEIIETVKTKPRLDRTAFSLKDSDAEGFRDWFDGLKEKYLIPNSEKETIDGYFEKKVCKGECNKR